MEAINKIKQLRSSFPNPNSLITQGMEDGKKVCGWICMQVCEEIIEAGGMMPVRVLGDMNKDTTIGDAHLHPNNCPYTRSCLATALRKGMDYFSALVAGNLCDHVRRFADEWAKWVNSGDKQIPYFFFWVPFKSHERAVQGYKRELVKMTATIEEASGKKITNDDLWEQIKVYHEMRTLFTQITEYRKKGNTRISGSDFMEAILVAQQSPKAEFNKILKELLAELETAPVRDPSKIRVMMIGSEMDDPAFVRLIEDAGAEVIADDLCTGNGYFWHKVQNLGPSSGADPLDELARRYMTGIVCPRMTPPTQKHDLVKEMITTFKPDAIIYTVLKFCEPHISHWQPVSEIAKEADIPTLWLEREYSSGAALGQFKTRIEAFMEQLLEI
jgi:benzoyl-CoA reductase subunit C